MKHILVLSFVEHLHFENVWLNLIFDGKRCMRKKSFRFQSFTFYQKCLDIMNLKKWFFNNQNIFNQFTTQEDFLDFKFSATSLFRKF